jgi:hypothetical protein
MNVDYKISPVKTQKDEVTHPKLSLEGVIPKLNTSNILVGKSGSGKSVLLHNLLVRPQFYKGHFDKTVLISPTGESDDVQRALKIKPSLVFTDLQEAVQAIGVIERVQEALIKEKGAKLAPKVCVVLDDCAGDTKFMASKEFVNLFIKSRHYNITVFFLTQHFKRLPRIARLQASTLYFYALSNSELEVLADEFAPPGCSKKAFMKTVDEALSEPYSFLCVNMREPWSTRFRCGLAMVIPIEKFRNGSSVRLSGGESFGQAGQQTGGVKARQSGERAERGDNQYERVDVQPASGQRRTTDARTSNNATGV